MNPRRNSRIKKSVLTLVISLLLGAPTAAWASPNYPDALLDVLQENGSGPPCSAPCVTCHRDSNGGKGTVDRPFGLKFYSLAVIAKIGPGQLSDGDAKKLFRQMRDGAPPQNIPSDSDKDGISDFDELENDMNPNPPRGSTGAGGASGGGGSAGAGGGAIDGGKLCEIAYGCGARVEPQGEVSTDLSVLSSAAVAFALAASLRIARRRSPRAN
jgi:hypothetical protein